MIGKDDRKVDDLKILKLIMKTKMNSGRERLSSWVVLIAVRSNQEHNNLPIQLLENL